MQVRQVDLARPDPEIIFLAAQVLKRGGLVIYPTDTAYGLGAKALDEVAVRKVYQAKGRDFAKPTHVVVRDWPMIERLCRTNALAKKLFRVFMPGPLTLILPKKNITPDLLTAGLPTLGVRLPKSLITQALSDSLDFPYTTPSANFTGGPAPYTAEQAIRQVGRFVDLVLDAGRLPNVTPSTIIDLTKTPPKILRQGPISQSQIERVLGYKLVAGI